MLNSFKIDWFDLLAPRDSQESSPAPQLETINSSAVCLLYGPALTNLRDYWEDLSLDYAFNTLSRFDIAFLPRNNRFLISRLQSPSAVILEPPKEEIYPRRRTKVFRLFSRNNVQNQVPELMQW